MVQRVWWTVYNISFNYFQNNWKSHQQSAQGILVPEQSYQSAYVSKRSTETALLKVQSDILNAVDRQKVVFLVMLDLSAAFDTIDHVMLLQHLQNNFGISGKSLQRIRSYLESRVYQVQIDGLLSDMHTLQFGNWNSSGLSLGPTRFILYKSHVGNIIC